MSRNKKMTAAALICTGLIAVPVSAQATESTESTGVANAASALSLAGGPTSSASVGAVDIVVNGQANHVAPIAPCDVASVPQNGSTAIDAGSVRYGRGTTTCTRNADGTVGATATGQRFETTVLQQFGGPTIKVRTYNVKCNTTANGSSGSMEVSGLTGVSAPSTIPANYTVTIPSKKAGDPPLASVIFNEFVVPSPADGSLTTRAMHIKLFPQGGPASGDILMGSASCDPYGD